MPIANETPFAAQELFVMDEEGRDRLVVVVKATYAIVPGRRLEPAAEQRAVDAAGTYYGDPDTSSHRFEPEVAPFKYATDVVLVGHAHAPRYGAPYVDVTLQVGAHINKTVRVFGDRVWFGHMGASISTPLPFERIPLQYERAFGGWDRTPEDPDRHVVEPRNPVGVGFHPTRHTVFADGLPLPNLEDPRALIRGYDSTPPPVGFGFVGPAWEPRRRYAGTYDDAWMATRMPLLPKDFDPRFYNAAPADQTVPGRLRGDERVSVTGATAAGRLDFHLPGTAPPLCTVSVENRPDHALELQHDTVIIDTDAEELLLLWRGHMPIPGGPHSVKRIQLAPAPVAAAPRAYSYPTTW